MRKLLLFAGAATVGFLILAGCNADSMPRGARAISPFDANRYLGKWYEIARFDFRFERDMIRTTAEYALNEDGSIKVTNRGYDTVKNEWKQAVGKAKFRDASNEGKLKVSFFGPFYSAYNVIALDEDYRYALVAGKNLDYLWLLSRDKSMPDSVRQQYLDIAKRIGYDIRKLIWVDQS